MNDLVLLSLAPRPADGACGQTACSLTTGCKTADGLQDMQTAGHTSYSEGDHCPLSLSEGPQARTFTAVKGRRPARISLFHSVKGRRPALSLQ